MLFPSRAASSGAAGAASTAGKPRFVSSALSCEASSLLTLWVSDARALPCPSQPRPQRLHMSFSGGAARADGRDRGRQATLSLSGLRRQTSGRPAPWGSPGWLGRSLSPRPRSLPWKRQQRPWPGGQSLPAPGAPGLLAFGSLTSRRRRAPSTWPSAWTQRVFSAHTPHAPSAGTHAALALLLPC